MKKIGFLILLLTACQKEPSTEFYSKKDYTYVSSLKSGVRITLKDSKQGVIDKNNKVVLPNIYKNINVIKDKIIYTKQDNTMGITSVEGKTLLKNEYTYVYPFQENYLIKNKNKVGIIDANEKVVVQSIYDEIRPFKEDRAIVVSDKKYGVIDKSGKEIVPPEYEYIQDFSNGMAMIIAQGRKAGFLNKDGIEVVQEIFKYTQPFKGNSTVVILDKEFGVINKNGEYTIKLQEERINPLGNDLYSIKEKDKMYLVDSNGTKISEQGYDSIGEQIEGVISVALDDKFGYIDSKGKIIIPISYTELGEPQNKLLIAKDETTQKFGVINFENNFVVEPKFDYILSRNNSFFIVGNENFKEGIVNMKGEIILPLEYSDLEFKYDNLAVGNNQNGEYKFIQVNNKSSLALDVNPAEVIDYNNNEIVIQNNEGTKIYKINGDK